MRGAVFGGQPRRQKGHYMPTMNADEQIEPVKVTIDETEYCVGVITPKMLEIVTSEMDDASGVKDSTTEVARRVAILLGVAEDTFADTEVRKIGAVNTFLTSTIFEQMTGKSGDPTEGEDDS